MRLRELFEAAPAQKVIAVMPGGFHPFHPGHKSLYDWAVETFGKDNVYVAATNDTKSRPFPFDVKIKLAQMSGVPTNRFIQVKSPFNALSYNDIISDASQTALVFVRSEKDKKSHPLPDQVRKSDGNMGYLISYTGNDNLETADIHGYLAYGPTIDFDFSGMSIKSASELRAAWPEMSDEDKLQAAELMYPGNAETATQLLNKALGVTEPAESIQEAENPAVAKKITPLKMTNPPKAPDATIPRTRDGYTKSDGTTYKQDKYDDKLMHVSDGGGDYTFDGARLIKWVTPRFKGVRQIHNFVQSTIKVDADIEIKTKDGPVMFSTDAVYDLEGNLKNAGKFSTSSAGLGFAFGNDEFNMDYVISDKLSIHVTGHPRKGKVSPEQVKTINNFIPKSEKDGLKQLINFANKAKEIGAKVTFKSPANQGAIPYRQGINMLTQGSK